MRFSPYLMLSIFTLLPALPLTAEENPETLVVGIFPRYNYTETIKMYSPLVKNLSERLQRKVKLETTAGFSAFWENVKEQKYDIVHYNQTHHIIASRQHHYKILLKNEENNQPTISSVIVSRKDSGITDLQDLKEKKIIFGGDDKAMMSYLIPKKMLGNAGLSTKDYKSIFARNPPNALLAVFLEQADACGVGAPLLKLNYKNQEINMDELNVIAVSDNYPHLAWAIKENISIKLAKKIRKILISTDKNILGRAKISGLLPATEEEYQAMYKYLEEESQ